MAHPIRTLLVDIDPRTCMELIESAPVGRLAVIVEGHPEIYPVSHVLDRSTGAVAFPTRAGTKLHAALTWPTVAFEVDGIEPDGAAGWSVLVLGHAELVDEADVAELAAARAARWTTGIGARWVRIVPSTISGRRITADR